MRQLVKFLVVLGAVAATTFVSQANAEFYGLPRVFRDHVVRLIFNAPSLAPMAYTVFCVRNPDDCRAPRFVFRPHGVALTPERYDDLVSVNREVNRSIVPRAESGIETWRVAPGAGNCHDFAVTKRHELLARGWPSKALILAEVVTASGEHHLVLVARTHDGDLVLDNLSATVRPMALTRYQWVRAQSPKNPNFWSTVQIAAS